MNLLKAGAPGILLGIGCTVITDLAGYLVYKLLKMDYPEVGGPLVPRQETRQQLRHL